MVLGSRSLVGVKNFRPDVTDTSKSILNSTLTRFGLMVMSPYEFTSKTHSLSTEDLGKFFID